MRIFCLIFLLLFAAAVGVFAYYNQEAATIRFMDRSWTSSLAEIAGIAYVLGMVSGWTVVGMVRRSTNRVVEAVEQRYTQNQA